MSSSSRDLSASNSLSKLLLMFPLGLGMTGLAASFIFVDYGREPRDFEIGFGLFGTAFFGWGTAIILSRLRDRRPMLRVDDSGIWWRPLSDDIIPWPAISRAWISQVRGKQFISLELRNPERFAWKGRFRIFQRLNSGMGFGDVTLSAQGLDCSFDQLQASVAAHVPLNG